MSAAQSSFNTTNDGNIDEPINMTTFNSESSTSSFSSQKFDLDPTSTQDILVYRVRHGCKICNQKDLCQSLDLGQYSSVDVSMATTKDQAEPSTVRCSRVPIPRGASRINLKTKDLWTIQERNSWGTLPNAQLSVASVGLPRSVYWRRMMMGHFQTLYIISPDHSPASSESSSPNDTHHPTPASTFNMGHETT